MKTRHIGKKQVKAKHLAPDAVGPRASATVDRDPKFIGSHVGFDSVSSPQDGIYCVTATPESGLDSKQDLAAVTAEWGNSSGDELLVAWVRNSFLCGGTRQYQVRTYDLNGVLSDEVGFTIIIP